MNVPDARRDPPRPESDPLRDPVSDWQAFHAARAAHRARLAETARRHREPAPRPLARTAR